MSISRQRARELVASYDLTLERQIVEGGSPLVCKDENLRAQVQALLKDGDAQDGHCLGLDPLQVMEKSLKAEATKTASCGGGARGGLRGLAKAFEVLEQAALNLYLGPWREEYKFVKMYSGVFTHYIKPVLTPPLIEKLFGLLGYRPCLGPHEQLQLQSRVGASSLDSLLSLSCAFFLARCECCLLLAALGKHSGDARWELSLVMERQQGRNLQVALDNTRKKLEEEEQEQPLEVMDGEVDLDLYTDENRDLKAQLAVGTHDGPRSLTWMNQSTPLTSAGKARSNGVTSLSSTPRESICITMLNCQLSSSSPPASYSTGAFSDTAKQTRHPRDEQTYRDDARSHSRRGDRMCEAERFSRCGEHADEGAEGCSASPSVPSALRHLNEHSTALPAAKDINSRAVLTQSGSIGARGVAPDLIDSGPTAVAPNPPHISFHACCDLVDLDPQVLCRSCWVFHCSPCREMEVCQLYHKVENLGVCSCGSTCSRNPLVLCRYCGAEYCCHCWYRNPLSCTCGQIFDQSSSV
ncbi:spermatogenesis-associated protein 2-like protein [Thalassophryne amazonica]|uniref:spermatogenesis-associated protein 2-like protein n=1 Tax=Thalassophryne amazonica TaxID=390379 RepID=UPI001471026A|nr:spermatogenesis-associated protein 2-like protein [Thalassophryne amazonica]